METPLSNMVLQPNSLQISNDKDCQRMTEVWKGPWSVLKDLTDLKTKTVFGVKLYPGIVRPSEMDTSLDWKKEFASPQASTMDENVDWLIDTVETRQIEAGDLGELTITYSSVRKNDTGGSGGNGDIPNGAFETQPTVWTLSWGTFTRSPLEYAVNSTGGTAQDIRNCYENSHPGSLAEAQTFDSSITEDELPYAYYMGTDDINRELKVLKDNQSPEATKIYDYLCKGITPQFHYPIIQKQDHFFLSAGFELNVGSPGADIDKITDLPGSCPYIFSDWEWLKTDDSYQINQNTFEGTSYTRTQTWTGARKWDENFYGPNAWEVPDPDGGDPDDTVNNSEPDDEPQPETPPEDEPKMDTPKEEMVINVPVKEPAKAVKPLPAPNGQIVKYDDLPGNTYIYKTSEGSFYLVRDYSEAKSNPKSKGWVLRPLVMHNDRVWNIHRSSKHPDGFYDGFACPIPDSAVEKLQKDVESGALNPEMARSGGKWFPDSSANWCSICGGFCPLGDPMKCRTYRTRHNLP